MTAADVTFGLRNLRGEWSVLTEWDGLWVLGYLLLGAGVGALESSPPAKTDGDGSDNPVHPSARSLPCG